MRVVQDEVLRIIFKFVLTDASLSAIRNASLVRNIPAKLKPWKFLRT